MVKNRPTKKTRLWLESKTFPAEAHYLPIDKAMDKLLYLARRKKGLNPRAKKVVDILAKRLEQREFDLISGLLNDSAYRYSTIDVPELKEFAMRLPIPIEDLEAQLEYLNKRKGRGLPADAAKRAKHDPRFRELLLIDQALKAYGIKTEYFRVRPPQSLFKEGPSKRNVIDSKSIPSPPSLFDLGTSRRKETRVERTKKQKTALEVLNDAKKLTRNRYFTDRGIDVAYDYFHYLNDEEVLRVLGDKAEEAKSVAKKLEETATRSRKEDEKEGFISERYSDPKANDFMYGEITRHPKTDIRVIKSGDRRTTDFGPDRVTVKINELGGNRNRTNAENRMLKLLTARAEDHYSELVYQMLSSNEYKGLSIKDLHDLANFVVDRFGNRENPPKPPKHIPEEVLFPKEPHPMGNFRELLNLEDAIRKYGHKNPFTITPRPPQSKFVDVQPVREFTVMRKIWEKQPEIVLKDADRYSRNRYIARTGRIIAKEYLSFLRINMPTFEEVGKSVQAVETMRRLEETIEKSKQLDDKEKAKANK